MKNNRVPGSKTALVKQILKVSGDIYHALQPQIPLDYLSPDFTVAQLRVLLVLLSEGPCRMGFIAAALDIALPTATGIIDNLVKKDYVIREADRHDRRLVICRLSPAGQELINKLWTSGEFQMERLLDGLTREQMQKAAEVAEMLLENITAKIEDAEKDGGE